MDSRSVWQLGDRPSLHGMRALAVGLVLLAHSRIPMIGQGGGVGVAIFFTLSGFLITALLLQEREVFGAIKVPAFYRRRALRLIPAMVVCVVLACSVMLILFQRIPDWLLVIGTVTYTSNWMMIDGDFPMPTGLGHTWSLAIEEQFYLIWPLILVLLARVSRRPMLMLMGTASVAVLVLRIVLWNGGAGELRIYFGFDTRADGLLIGAMLATMLHGQLERLTDERVVWGGLAVLAGCCATPGAPKAVVVPTIVSLATAGIIYSLVQGRGFALFELAVVQWVGKRSYGIYLYQSPLHVLILETLGDSPAWWVLIHVPASLLLAELSWRFVERPFQRRKNRDTRSHAGIQERLGDQPVRPLGAT
jgi:peptidoglycan/LPS O-acetylase OafA/YrhL